MEKRGQLFSEPFKYILIIVTIAFILFFGYKAVTYVIEVQQLTYYADFKIDLEKEINSIYNKNQGTTYDVSFFLPKKIQYICFKSKESLDLSTLPQIIKSKKEIFNLRDDNVFLFPSQENMPSFKIEKEIKLNNNPLCILIINQKLNLNLENIVEDSETKIEIS